ncbi:MAG: hypothetical protein JWQ66_374 [Mucilaginibacter sp.]|nr:hypothetical protein [Mucilaginibacter sp.]
MKNLINGQFYEVTGGTEVAYLTGALIPITDVGESKSGSIYQGAFISLDTGSSWKGLPVFIRCDRVIKRDTLKVVGQRSDNN